MKRLLFIIFFGLSFALVDCGATQSNKEGGVEGGECTPGQQINCGCSVGRGVQVCKDDGTGYGTCLCGDGGVDGGRDATIIDSGHDSASDSGSSGDGPCECGEGGMDGGKDAPTDTSMKDGGTCIVEGGADAGPGGTLNWAKRFGITGGTNGISVALDPKSSDVALTGFFAGTANFGGGVVSAGGDAGGAGPSGSFLIKFDSAGGYKWEHTLTSDMGVDAYGVAIDSSGNVVVGGQLEGTTDFGGGSVTSTGIDDLFLAKYNSTGTYIWSKHFGFASNFCFFKQAAFDSSGDLYVVGEPGGNAVDFGCGPLPTGMAMFVAEFDTSGSCVWSKAFGTNTQNERLALDPSGNVLVAGGFFGSIDFGSGTKAAPGSDLDVFIAKFGPSGALSWAKTFDSGTGAQAHGIGVDPCGNIVVAGDFSGTLDLGSGSMTTATDSVFVAKLDPSGGGIWSHKFVPTGSILAVQGLAVDAFGGPAVTGAFSNSIDFGGGGLLGEGAPFAATYIAKFNSDGAYQWAYAGGPPASTATNSAGEGVVANGSAVIAVGEFQGGTLSLDGKSMAAMSMQDTYLASFAH